MQTSSPHWRAVAALVWPSARRYAVLTAVVVASSALVLAALLLLRALIDRSIGGAATGELALLAGWYLAIVIVQYSQQIRRPLEDITSAVLDDGDTSPPEGALSVTFEDVTLSYGDRSPMSPNLKARRQAPRF